MEENMQHVDASLVEVNRMMMMMNIINVDDDDDPLDIWN
jgi:hypothetical protein